MFFPSGGLSSLGNTEKPKQGTPSTIFGTLKKGAKKAAKYVPRPDFKRTASSQTRSGSTASTTSSTPETSPTRALVKWGMKKIMGVK